MCEHLHRKKTDQRNILKKHYDKNYYTRVKIILFTMWILFNYQIILFQPKQ